VPSGVSGTPEGTLLAKWDDRGRYGQIMLTVEDVDGVAVVRLDHGKVNALDLELLDALVGAMGELADVPVVLTGTGKVFSAGVDLRRVVDGGPAYVAEFLPRLSAAFLAVFDHPRPTVAAVNGHAIAGGCVLAGACDIRLMSGGSLGLTELLVGVPFPVAALEIVRFAAGPAAAMLALTGRTITPDTACRIGLMSAVVEPDGLIDEALRRAWALGALPADAYALTKEQLHRPTRETIDAARAADDPRVAALWSSPQALDAMASYLDDLPRTDRGEVRTP
jgi:enoyl-CoA hydratase